MTTSSKLDLYQLLPALYRLRDSEQGEPLRALLAIIAEQAGLVKTNIDELWDDFFIETCADWVIPYIGDLVGNNLLHEALQRRRADVAKTIYYRRHKGTLPMLEELARDVTGWGAHAVAFFELLGWMQQLEHQRPQAAWVDIRSPERMERISGPFDDTSHTIDVRHPAQHEGWHNIHTIGCFLWRLASYPLKNVPARRAGQSWQYHFSPLGNPAPLFTRLRREGDEAGLAGELHVPGPIRPAFFYQDLERYRKLTSPRPDYTDLYGLFEEMQGSSLKPCPECSLTVFHNGPVALAEKPKAEVSDFNPQIVCGRLDPWPTEQPAGNVIVVDVRSGRLALGDKRNVAQPVDVCFHYGFSAEIGGGSYDRRERLEQATTTYSVRAQATQAGEYATLVGTPAQPGALDAWLKDGRPNAIIAIADSRTYQLPASISLPNEGWLTIQAANGERPLLSAAGSSAELTVAVSPPVASSGSQRAALTLNGVVVEGWIRVTGDLGQLRLIHATLVPGRSLKEDGEPASGDASLLVEGYQGNNPINASLVIECDSSITGPLSLHEHIELLSLRDTIVDGLGGKALSGIAGEPGPALVVERATVLGTVDVTSLEASAAIFTEKVTAVRRQAGCIRFSYAPPDSALPRRYRCQPDLAIEQAIEQALKQQLKLSQQKRDELAAAERARVVPAFTTLRYGRPAYVQLAHACPDEIRAGAEDGSEMGVFSSLQQPQRETNLRIRLQEYLPFGLEPGFIFVT